MAKVYFYVVDRDFGFAPNPFHGYCTLATCKPILRRVAKSGDWIVGMGGKRLKATGRCVFAMRVSKAVSFNEYWSNPIYRAKRPVRNGTNKMVVGDNIYFKKNEIWHQADSHHSNIDGSTNFLNLNKDTQSDAVLISDYFYYLGSSAIQVPKATLLSIGYKNGRHHRVLPLANALPLITYIERNCKLNYIAADPYDFNVATARYSGKGSKLIRARES